MKFSRISDECLFFMSITTVFSSGRGGCALDRLVRDEAGWVVSPADDSPTADVRMYIVIWGGLALLSCRLMIMGTAGLWYFNRGRYWRQNFLFYLVSSLLG